MADLKKYGFELDEDGWIKVTEENAKLINFPRQKISSVKKIIYIDEKNRWALALLLWEGSHRLATRWFWSKIGDPNSRGYPTWHTLPNDFAMPILTSFKDQGKISEEDCKYCLEKIKEK